MSWNLLLFIVALKTALGLQCTAQTSDQCVLVCDTSNTCAFSTFDCPKDKDCTIKCNSISQCNHLEVNCPRNGKCSIDCDASGACIEAVIDCGLNNQDCKLVCNGRNACYLTEIYWPIDQDVNRTLVCDPDGNDHANSSLASCSGLIQHFNLTTMTSNTTAFPTTPPPTSAYNAAPTTTPPPTINSNAFPFGQNTPSPTPGDNGANAIMSTQIIAGANDGNNASSDYTLTVLIAVITGVSCTCLWCSIGIYVYCKLLKRKGKMTKDVENLTVKQSMGTQDNTVSVKVRSNDKVGKNGIIVQDNEISDDSMDRDTPEHIIDGNTMNVSSESVNVEDIEGYVEPQLNRFKTGATDLGIEELYDANHHGIETYDGAGNHTSKGNDESSVNPVYHSEILDTSKYIG